jgi:hypothetical protein
MLDATPCVNVTVVTVCHTGGRLAAGGELVDPGPDAPPHPPIAKAAVAVVSTLKNARRSAEHAVSIVGIPLFFI